MEVYETGTGAPVEIHKLPAPAGTNTSTRTPLNWSKNVAADGYVNVYLKVEYYHPVVHPLYPEKLIYYDDLEISTHGLDIIQENHYYPFGMNLYGLEESDAQSTVPLKENMYQYNSKERETSLDLHWYDYRARQYDVQLGRWNGGDPLAEKYNTNSPYNYVVNNPIIFIDPDRREIEVSHAQKFFLEDLAKMLLELSDITGLNVKLEKKDGKFLMGYSFKEDEEGNVDLSEGSASARNDLIYAIESDETVSVFGSKRITGADYQRGQISMGFENLSQWEGIPYGTEAELDPLTYGFGMTFLHELHHTKLNKMLNDFARYAELDRDFVRNDLGLGIAPDDPQDLESTGSTVNRVSQYRAELDALLPPSVTKRFGKRMHYNGVNESDPSSRGKALIFDVNGAKPYVRTK